MLGLSRRWGPQKNLHSLLGAILLDNFKPRVTLASATKMPIQYHWHDTFIIGLASQTQDSEIPFAPYHDTHGTLGIIFRNYSSIFKVNPTFHTPLFIIIIIIIPKIRLVQGDITAPQICRISQAIPRRLMRAQIKNRGPTPPSRT